MQVPPESFTPNDPRLMRRGLQRWRASRRHSCGCVRGCVLQMHARLACMQTCALMRRRAADTRCCGAVARTLCRQLCLRNKSRVADGCRNITHHHAVSTDTPTATTSLIHEKNARKERQHTIRHERSRIRRTPSRTHEQHRHARALALLHARHEPEPIPTSDVLDSCCPSPKKQKQTIAH
eukprot:3243920-Pleurochrysis_carterae.AAC.2